MPDDQTPDVLANEAARQSFVGRLVSLLRKRIYAVVASVRALIGHPGRRGGAHLALIGVVVALMAVAAFLGFRTHELDLRVKHLREQIAAAPRQTTAAAPENPLPSFQLVVTIHFPNENGSTGEMSFFQYAVPNSRADGPLTTLAYSFEGLQPNTHYSVVIGSCPGQTGPTNAMLMDGFLTDSNGAAASTLDNLSLPPMTAASWLRVYSPDGHPVTGFRGSLQAGEQRFLGDAAPNC